MQIKQIASAFLLFFMAVTVKAQTINYVRSWDAQKPVTDAATITATSAVTDAIMRSQYIDGIGRPVQTVSKGISPLAKDMVIPVVYDVYGRQQYTYLPYVSPGVDGSYKSAPLTEQQSFYSSSTSPVNGQGETMYYSQTDYEPSPLNRVQKVFAPGNSWVGSRGTSSEKSIEIQYSVNISAEGVRIWTIGTAAGSLPASTAVYPGNQLYKTITIDQAKHQVVEYKDGEQRIILKKVQLAASPGTDHTGWLCTYYVYDDFGNLRFVLQPRAVELINSSWSVTQTIADELCFRYEYDNRHRVIIKKVPGAGEAWMVYDNRDRLVYTQDGGMRSKSWWLTTIYDNLNRPVQTGMLTSSSTRASLQTYVNSLTGSATTISAAGTGISSAAADLIFSIRETGRTGYQATSSIEFTDGFTSEEGSVFTAEIVSVTAPSFTGSQAVNMTTLPAGSYVPLTMTFYDNYNFTTGKTYSTTNNSKLSDIGTNAYADALPSSRSTLTKGMMTGSRVRVIEDANDLAKGKWMETATFYDDKGRAVQTQADNYKGGTDIVTTRFSFAGVPLITYMVHNNNSGGVTNLRVRTLMNYDFAGRVLNVVKSVNDGTAKTILQNSYDELGQLKTKNIGADPVNTSSPLETLTYDYNIRGWLLGMNRDYAKTGSNTTNYFGFDLGYDKTALTASGGSAIGSYAAAQYNGNIEGTVWKSKGDGEIRKCDYTYDNVNWLTAADFNQYTGTSFNRSANVDFSVSNLSYDANGNILTMRQKGLTLNTSSLIDDLTYKYNFLNSSGVIVYSNRLQNVTDASNDPQTKMGDFRYSSAYNTALGGTKPSTATDYSYDANGSMTQDKNKDISAISYNYLNLPYTVSITNKGTITYIYDAVGNKLEKRTVDNTTLSSSATTTTYIGGFVYQNNILQFFGHEEGRVRKKTDGTFAYDYFLKDHLGNVRTVLTDESQVSQVYQATVEPLYRTTELALFGNELASTEKDKSSVPGFDVDNSNTKVTYLKNDGNTTTPKIGPGVLLKVMAGDKVKIRAQAWYRNQDHTGSNNSAVSNVLTQISNLLTNTIPAAAGSKFSSSQIQNNGSNVLNTNLPGFFSGKQSTDNSRPKAYINWVLLSDAQLNYISAGSGAMQIPAIAAGAQKQLMQATGGNFITLPKNGYLYVYLSNESSTAVSFDDFRVDYQPGQLLEETHYYPFGLVQAGISSKAAGGLENKRGFQGKELQSKEFSDGSGLELYDFGAREQDPQIGRWWTIDPKAEKYYSSSPYNFVDNNPISRIDPTGKDWFYYQGKGEEKKTWHYQEGHKATYTNVKGVEKTMKHGYSHLVTFKATGTNSEGAKTGSLTVYNQNKAVVTVPTTFTGGVGGTNPTLPGTYIMNLSIRDDKGPQKMNAAKDNPEPAWGIQRIVNRYINASGEGTNNTAGGYDIQGAYGRGRIRLLETDGDANGDGNILVPQKQTHGYYLHGKLDAHNITHGCVCDKSEAVFNYFWGGDGKNVQVKIPFSVE